MNSATAAAEESRENNNDVAAVKDRLLAHAPTQFQRIPGLHSPPPSPSPPGLSPSAAAVRFSRRKMSFPAAAPSSSLYHGRRGFSPATPGGGGGAGFANLGNISEIPDGAAVVGTALGPACSSSSAAEAVAFNRRIRRFSNVSDAVSRY